MIHKTICLFAMLAAFAANIAFSQKNSIRLQTGLFHYFFDKSPILNLNYPSNNQNDIFNGLLINSIGLSFVRAFNEKSQLGIEVQSFNERYTKHITAEYIEKPIVGWRNFITIGTNYQRKTTIHDKIFFTYGAGIHFRNGDETIIVSRFPIGTFNGQTVYELLVEHVERNDIGINLTTGLGYSPKKWLTFYSNIDLLSFVYINDKAMTKELKEVYNSPQYPTRFDLSLKFGIGFNF